MCLVSFPFETFPKKGFLPGILMLCPVDVGDFVLQRELGE